MTEKDKDADAMTENANDADTMIEKDAEAKDVGKGDCSNILEILRGVDARRFSPKEFYEKHIGDYEITRDDIAHILKRLDSVVTPHLKQQRSKKKELVVEIKDGKKVTLKSGNVGKFDYNIRRFTYMLCMVGFDCGIDVSTIMKELVGVNNLKIFGIEMCYWKYPTEACVAIMAWFYKQKADLDNYRRMLTTLLNQANDDDASNVLEYITSHMDDITVKVADLRKEL